MDCHAAFETMSAALDGELDAGEADALRAHLGGCGDCRTRRRDLVDTDRTLRVREARRVRVPSRLRTRITEIAAVPAVLAMPPRRRRMGLAFGLTLVGGALIGGVLVAILRPTTVVQTVVVQGPAAEGAGRSGAGPRLAEPPVRVEPDRLETEQDLAASAEGAGRTPGGAVKDAGSAAGAVAGGTKDSKGVGKGAVAAGPSLLELYASALAAAPRAGAVAAGGTVRGIVELDGTPPPAGIPPTLLGRMTRDAAPAMKRAVAACDQEFQLFRVKDRRLADVHVSISAAARPVLGDDLPPVPIPVSTCGVGLRTVAAFLRQPIYVHTTDATRHSVEAFLDDGTYDPLSSSGHGRFLPWSPVPKVRGIDRAGVYELRCRLHDSHRGHLVVSETPYFAVTGDDGAFSIAGLPPGRHQLRAWHEGGGDRLLEVTVRPNEVSEVRLAFEAKPAPTPAPAPAPEPKIEPSTEAAAVTVAAVTVEAPCRIATSGDSPVARACTEGGIPRAWAYMREVVRDVRRRRGRLDCDSCHLDRKTYALRPDARLRLGQVLVALHRQ